MKTSIAPQGQYALARRHGDLVFVSGITPRRNGKLVSRGPIQSDALANDFRDAFDLTIGNALLAAASSLETGETLKDVLQMTVYLAVDESFERHTEFADLASTALLERLRPPQPPSRAAIGVRSLPSGASVEITIIGTVGTRPPP